MLKLNLLPPQEKKKIEWANLSRLVISLSIWFIIFLTVFNLFLVGDLFFFSTLLDSQKKLLTVRETDPNVRHLIEIEEKIGQSNQLAKRIGQKQKDLILWLPLLEEMSQITPNGVYLTAFSYQTAQNQISLTGWADQRENLLLFQDSLKESPSFAEVESPLTNLLKQRDINFNFTLLLK